MTAVNTTATKLAEQALKLDAAKEFEYPQLGHIIEETLRYSPTVRLVWEAGVYRVKAANGYVLATDKSAVRAWIEAHDDFTPCQVLD